MLIRGQNYPPPSYLGNYLRTYFYSYSIAIIVYCTYLPNKQFCNKSVRFRIDLQHGQTEHTYYLKKWYFCPPPFSESYFYNKNFLFPPSYLILAFFWINHHIFPQTYQKVIFLPPLAKWKIYPCILFWCKGETGFLEIRFFFKFIL